MDSLSRRNFFNLAGAGVGTLLAGSSLAQACGIATSEQPLGPFFPRPGTPQSPIGENDNDLTFVNGQQGSATGQVVHVKGQLTDGACRPISGATLIIWQASASGRYNHRGDAANQSFSHPVTGEVIERSLDPFFQYWGQATSDEKGEYLFKTIVPGFYPADLQSNWYRPPHIHFLVSAMGFPQLVTQMYFRGGEIADNNWIQQLNQRDFLLQNSDMTSEQREKLVVDFKREGGHRVGQFDIILNR